MAEMTVTNCNATQMELEVDIKDAVKDVLTAAGANTYKKGTIMARDSVSGKLVVFVKGGSTNENGIPKTILAAEVVTTGAGDVDVKVYKGGRFRKDYLVIFADGDASNIDKVVEDQMRDFTFMADTFVNLSVLDNQ